MSQGYIGAQLTCALMNQLHEFDIMRSVVDVVTHVVVDDDDPAFKDLEKPIGAFMTKDEAEKLSKAEGVPVKEDSGRGWRRVVASPRPQHILEIDQIRDLMDAGYVVVACGGAGIPVVENDRGRGRHRQGPHKLDSGLEAPGGLPRHPHRSG